MKCNVNIYQVYVNIQISKYISSQVVFCKSWMSSLVLNTNNENTYNCSGLLSITENFTNGDVSVDSKVLRTCKFKPHPILCRSPPKYVT